MAVRAKDSASSRMPSPDLAEHSKKCVAPILLATARPFGEDGCNSYIRQ